MKKCKKGNTPNSTKKTWK